MARPREFTVNGQRFWECDRRRSVAMITTEAGVVYVTDLEPGASDVVKMFKGTVGQRNRHERRSARHRRR